MLFAIWSVVSFVFEVPSGALADAWSRRGLYAIGELLTAAGYALWLLWPTFTGFALGFVLWGIGGALSSGTLEALVYDQLESVACDPPESVACDPPESVACDQLESVACDQLESVASDQLAPEPVESASDHRAEPRLVPGGGGSGAAYAKLMGRSGTVGILAMLAATLLATPAFAAGGYRLVGIISIATVTLGGLLALRLPDSRPPAGTDEEAEPGWSALLWSGLRESARTPAMLLTVLIAALVPGFTALDEYLPLLARDKGAPTTAVPLLFGLTALAMAAGSALAGRYAARLSAVVAAAAALIAVGALTPHLAGMAAVSAAFGLLQFAMIRAETRLQDEITGPARTTVLSVSGFAAEVFAVLLYAWFALALPLPTLFALAAVPMLLTAALALLRGT
jgi:hypothetical protein